LTTPKVTRRKGQNLGKVHSSG